MAVELLSGAKSEKDYGLLADDLQALLWLPLGSEEAGVAGKLAYKLTEMLELMKGRSSHLLRQEVPWLRSRLPTLWANSPFVATVGGAPLAIQQSIEDQKRV
jgi:hypothetical protein